MNYYTELPNNYNEIYKIDASSKKIGIILNIIATIIFFILFILLMGIKRIHFVMDYKSLIYTIIFIISYILYMVLHELTHGLFYKIYTHQKLTFGLKLSCAYCGVPNIYVKKNPMIIISIMPFVIFNLLFIQPIFIFDGNLSILFILMFSLHFGGCSGDLFVVFKLLSLKGNILINDTGPCQTFYKGD